MSQEAEHTSGKSLPLGRPRALDLGLALSFGLLVGVVLNNVAVGLALGLLSAVTYNAYYERRSGQHGAGTALAITLGAWVFAALVVGLSWAGLP